MKIYFVAEQKEDKTAITPFTSAVKQKAHFKSHPGSWMYGPIDFPLNSKGIMNALEYGIKSHSITVDNCDDYACGGAEE